MFVETDRSQGSRTSSSASTRIARLPLMERARSLGRDIITEIVRRVQTDGSMGMARRPRMEPDGSQRSTASSSASTRMAHCPRMEKWMTNILDSSYCTFLVSLLATVLSFADPTTDLLTLREFFRENDKTWFFVGWTFIFLPCMSFAEMMRIHGSFTEICLCGFTPYSLAWVRLKICWKNFKKCCWGDNGDDNSEDNDNLKYHENEAQFVEAVLESAPQFIIQLYAMTVQQEPVKIIQMISVPVSFLSLVWAFTTYDSKSDFSIFVARNVKQKVVLFANYLFVLSSRLFAIAFFTITYKWWIVSVLMIHSVLILIVDTIWSCRMKRVFKGWSPRESVQESILNFSLHWLRDDMSPTIRLPNTDGEKVIKRRMHQLSNILFVIENCTIILVFYRFSKFSNTWYSLPVTVCVCLFSVIGAVARVAHVYFVTKKSNRENDNPNVNTAEVGNETSR